MADALALDPVDREARAVALATASAALPPAQWLDKVIGHARVAVASS
jgi:hypothetical protein